ncbi:NEAT domain-containing protein [Clostridium butyricum]|uniref:NEAT domain-containing protein n=1 Tax=Clostridium butyricum TaxID=1492 RepID=UPI0013D21E44|nr:NEAT domain-containing protein [Clostridium butyricum]MCQ2016235.1 NEAT domain-containing protein [Clostridium butyricum]MCQ2023672.1 NEAT domain-containing protein [Clostridium butyricum]NFB71901.1 cell wall anchor protein [Clostridium butyricum]NFB91804.1 cell wall anchor protein [Clostridium butyricum]UTY54669.1 cell wall anchor protein [Clostridium butyricum]
MKKIMSMILSLTIVLGLITPVQATETLVINNENEETIHLEDIVDSENIELEENEDETSELINKDTEVNLEGIDKTVDDEKAHSEESTDTEVEDKELDTPSYTIDGDMENYLEEYLNSLNKEESNADLEIDSEMEEYLNSLIIDEQLSEEDLEDGMYTADFAANKTGTSDYSSMAKYIDTEKSRIKIKNGKITVQLVINDSNMVVSTSASVNGASVDTKRIDIDDTSYIAEFKLGSIKDEINITVDCNYAAIIPSMGIKQHDFDLLISDVTYLEELPEEEEEENFEDGVYTADFAANKTGTESSSSMAKYIDTEKSRIKIKNGKITVQLVINDSNMVVKTSASVNGVSVDTKRTDIDDTSYIAEFKLGSIKDEINITVDCNYAAIVPSMGIKQHDFDLAISNITYFEDLDDKDEDIENPDDGSGETYPEEENKTLSDGTYTIESTFLKDNSTSTSAAGNYLNSKSTLTVENGNYTLTLNISQYADAFSDLSATVDGVTTKDINFVKNPDGTGTISFSINSLSSSISVGCTLTIKEINYVNTTSFDVKLDTSTIKDENGNDVEAPEEEILNVKKDAIYSINNKVVAGSNGTIPESARYLDTSSSVEVKYENIFATLVFNMADFMDKRTITLNENTSATPYSVKTQDNKTYVSFMITSLSDKIHISGKSTKDTDDSFTVVFDSATLVEIKDTGNSGSDSGSSSDSDDDDDDLDSGTYTIKNKVLKEDSDSESHAREYVDKESVVTVKNNKIYLTLKFKNASVIKGVSIKVEGDKTSYSTVKKTSDKLYIKFRIGSLSDEILVTTNLDLSDFGIENHDGLAFRVLLRSSTLEEDDDADNYDDEEDDEDEDDEDETATDTSINDNGTIKDPQNDIVNAPPVNTNSQYKKTTYRVNNEIITESSFGYQAARGAVNKVSYYEIIDDKKYITLGFSQTDIMNNIRLSINGKQINYDVVSKDDSKKTLDIRFEVPSISTQVTVTTNVTAMGRDISFGVEFLESTLELISTEEAESLPELAGNSSGVSESNSSGSVLSKITNAFSSNKTNSEDKLVVEEEAAKDLASLAKEYFKKYTVTNEIVSDSAIGRTMARKYLNQTSIIEDIDGQLYATITFSSSGSMGNFKIEVNGEVVEHTVPLNDMANELISLRFPINNVNDDIKAYIYINPMRMNINFGIKFLEDSMILIEEGTVGEEGNIESSSLADTLSQVNESSKDSKEQTSAVKIAASTSVMVIVLNQVISALGVLLKRIKAKSLLRKIAEK